MNEKPLNCVCCLAKLSFQSYGFSLIEHFDKCGKTHTTSSLPLSLRLAFSFEN